MKNLKRTQPSLTGARQAPHTRAYLQAMLQATDDLVFICTGQGFILEASNACEPLLGYAPGELKGSNIYHFLFPEDARYAGQHAAGCNTTVFEATCLHKNGGVVSLQWTTTWHPEEGFLLCMGRDLREKKQQEQERLYYEKQLKKYNKTNVAILERITDGFFAVDENCDITFWNKQAEVISGFARDTVIGKNLWATFPMIAGLRFHNDFQTAKETQMPVHSEAYYPASKIWLETSIYPSLKGASVFIRNITEKKQTAEELQKLSLIASEILSPIIISDAEARIQWVNKAFTTCYGYELPEVLGKQLPEVLVGPETDLDLLNSKQEQLNRRENIKVEQVFYTRTQEQVWVVTQAQPIHDEHGHFKMFFSIHSVITECKKLQEQLQRQMKQQQRAIAYAEIKAQEQVRSQIGRELHDNINQVLTTVKLYTELCLSQPQMSADLLQKSIHYLNGCIEEIRGLSKALSAPTIGNVSIKDSIKELIDSVEATHRLAITYDTSGLENKTYSKDIRIALFRIVQEHVTNVLKHAQATELLISLQATDGAITCLIKDNGIGFDTGRHKQGIGITNMISRAEVLNGSVTLQSAPGQGCTLTVQLPETT
jgi:PAS domain S-box-containing protein